MRIYSISLLFVVQVWNIEFYQCLKLVQITLPVIEITHYQGDYTTSLAVYTYIVSTTACVYIICSKRVSPYILSYYMLKKYT
jgi:hypothetical protein